MASYFLTTILGVRGHVTAHGGAGEGFAAPQTWRPKEMNVAERGQFKCLCLYCFVFRNKIGTISRTKQAQEIASHHP